MTLYKWANVNHGKSTIPKWNFHKILINKEEKYTIHSIHLLHHYLIKL